MNTKQASAIPSRNKQAFTAPIVSWFLSEADRLPVFYCDLADTDMYKSIIKMSKIFFI